MLYEVITVDDTITDGNDYASDMLLDADGRIIVAGFSFDNSNNTMTFIARYNSDGTLDSTLDGEGIVFYDYSDAYTNVNKAVYDLEGNIVLLGMTRNNFV